MGFIGFRWGFFFRIFPANAEVDFFFCWVYGGFSGAHGQVTLPMIFGLMNHQALDFPTVHGLSRDSCGCFFLRRWSIVLWLGYPETDGSQPGPHCALMISRKRFREKVKQTLCIWWNQLVLSFEELGICRASLGVLWCLLYIKTW